MSTRTIAVDPPPLDQPAQDQVAGLLLQLDQLLDADGIAEFLGGKQIRGQRGIYTGCAVACWVTGELGPGYIAEVYQRDILAPGDWVLSVRAHAGHRARSRFPLSRKVGQFAEWFDDGRYPHLVHTAPDEQQLVDA